MTDESADRCLVDFIRGVAIILMLWGHSIQYCCGGQFDFYENTVFKFIYSFHMPFFMLISGYLFFFSEQKRELVNLIEYKTKSLLYPILMCSVLNHILTKIPSFLIGGGRSGILGGVPVFSLWFLWSILSASIAVGFAVKLFKNVFLQFLLFVVGIGIVAIFPWENMNIYMYPYFVIGYLYSRNRGKLVKYFNMSGIVSLLAFLVMLYFFQKKHYIYTSSLSGGDSLVESLKIDFFRWAIGLFGSVAMIWGCKMVHLWVVSGKFMRVIENLGKDSLAVYALSVSLLSYWLPRMADAIQSRYNINWNSCIWLYNLIITPCVTAMYAVLLLLIIKLMKKYNVYRLIFGR